MRVGISLRRESLWAGCILALLLVAVFFPAVLGTRTLLASAWTAPSIMPGGAYHEGALPPHQALSPDPGAPAWTLEPWIKVIGEQYLREKQFPLWNPYNAFGTPFAAAMQPQPFFPLTALLSLHPTPWTYNIFIIARLLLAGILTFLFARLFLDYAAAVFASIAFMLNGYFIIFLAMPHLSVEVLLPGLFLTFELLVRKTSWPRLVAAAGDDLLVHMRWNARISVFGDLVRMPLCRLSPASITRAERQLYVTGRILRGVIAAWICALGFSVAPLYRIYGLRS